jgi:hypothetical protein
MITVGVGAVGVAVGGTTRGVGVDVGVGRSDVGQKGRAITVGLMLFSRSRSSIKAGLMAGSIINGQAR